MFRLFIERRIIEISYGTELKLHDYQSRFNLQYVLGAVVQPAGCKLDDVIVRSIQDNVVTDKLQFHFCVVD